MKLLYECIRPHMGHNTFPICLLAIYFMVFTVQLMLILTSILIMADFVIYKVDYSSHSVFCWCSEKSHNIFLLQVFLIFQ